MLRWLANLITLQEKRAFHGETVVLFAIFVGSMRLLFENLLVGHQGQVARDFVIETTWYVLCFFVYGLPVRLLAPPPWQRRVNVVLIGLFLGFLPPVIDVLVGGWGHVIVRQGGFGYSYVWNFPEGWSWSMLDPEKVSLGEGIVLWATVVLTAVYLWIRTESVGRALAGLGLAYLACLTMGALVPTFASALGERYWPEARIASVVVVVQWASILALYFGVYRPSVGRRLLARSVHVLPLLGVALVGYAWIRELDLHVVEVLGLVGLGGVVTVLENDHWDDPEEHPDRPERVARADLVVVYFVALAAAMMLFAESSLLAVILAIYGVASFLYNSPLYRGKRYFPANLKLEGLAGGAAFLFGMIGAASPLVPRPDELPFPTRFGGAAPIAALLAFAGWSALASLKDEKDVEADTRTGTQTVFTLLGRRGTPVAVVAGRVRAAALVCLLAAAWLPSWVGRSDPTHALAMSVLALPIALHRGADPSRSFAWRLVLLAVLLGVLAHGASRTVPSEPTPPPPEELTPARPVLPGDPLYPIDHRQRRPQALEPAP